MTISSFDLLLKNGIAVLTGMTVPADIGVKDGKIVAIGALGNADAAQVIDCKGLHVLPGIIDSQVHFREPGADHKEVLESGLRAACWALPR